MSSSTSDAENLQEEEERLEGGPHSLKWDEKVDSHMEGRREKMLLRRASTTKAVQSLQASHAKRAATLCSFLQKCRDDPHLTDDSPILKFLHVVPARDLSSAFDLPSATNSMCIFDILRIFHGHKYVLLRDWKAEDGESGSEERVSVELVWHRAAFTEVALQSDDLYEPVSSIAAMVPEIPTVMISDTLDLVLQTMCLTGSEHVATVNDAGLITGVLSFDKIYESLINEIEAQAGLVEEETTVGVDPEADDDKLTIANAKDRERARHRVASDRKVGGLRQTATDWIESPCTELLILVMLIVDATASVLEMTGGVIDRDQSGIQNPLTAVTGTVLIVFVFEAALRLFSLRGSIVWRPLDLTDTVIIVISVVIFALTVARITDPSLKGLISLGRILRLMRLVKFAKRLRKIVGANKSRYQKDGFDLDLTYITPSCIAMSLPATGAEAHFRNPIDEVQRFFYTMHPGHFLIFNLCAERTYDAAMFGGFVERICVEDHNPPRVDQLISFIQRVSSFLEQDPDNVFAVHCKGGKGRTGVFVCAWLMFSTYCQSAEAAMELFARLRTGRKAKAVQGVSGAGQRRYLEYFDSVLSEGGYRTNRLVLEKIVMRTCPHMDTDGGCDPWFSIEENGVKVFDWAAHKGTLLNMAAGTAEMVFEGMNVNLFGDVRIRFFDRDYMPRRDEAMFFFWFHTGFVTATPLVLSKPNIDVAWADKHCKIFSDRFQVECHFARIPTQQDKIAPSPPVPPAHQNAADERLISASYKSLGGSSSLSAKAYRRLSHTKSFASTELGPWIPVQGPSFRVQELARKYKGVKPIEKGVIDATDELQYSQLEPLQSNFCPAEGAPVEHRSVHMYGHGAKEGGGGGPTNFSTTFMHLNLAKVARRKVSGNKRRFTDDGFDLDLTYITPRMIAMGFPSTGWEGQYRNDEAMVYRFFQQRHADHYLIVNLCDERSYSLHTFHEAVVRYPFTDHEPPALELLLLCCAHIHSFLQADIDNVVAVHCKAGKGRTGVAIVASLLYAGLYVDATLARKFYDMRRTLNHHGLTIRSQIRYTHYFEEILRRLQAAPRTVALSQSAAPSIVIHRVRLNTIPHFDLDGGCDPVVKIVGRSEEDHQPVVLFETEASSVKHVRPSSKVFDLELPAVRVAGDFAINLFDQDLLAQQKMGCVWLHSLFMSSPPPDEICGVHRLLSAEECARENLAENTASLTIKKEHVDGASKDLRDAKFDPDFHFEIFFTCASDARGCGGALPHRRSQSAQSSAQDQGLPHVLGRARAKYARAMLHVHASSAPLTFEQWVVKNWTGSDFGEYGHGIRHRTGSMTSVYSNATKASTRSKKDKRTNLRQSMSVRTFTASRTNLNGFSSFASRRSLRPPSPTAGTGGAGRRTSRQEDFHPRPRATSPSFSSSETSDVSPPPVLPSRARAEVLPRASSPTIHEPDMTPSGDDGDDDKESADAGTPRADEPAAHGARRDSEDWRASRADATEEEHEHEASQSERSSEGVWRPRRRASGGSDGRVENKWARAGSERGKRAGLDVGGESARSYASSTDPWLLGQDTHCTLTLKAIAGHPLPQPTEAFRRALEKDLATALGIRPSAVSCDKVARTHGGHLEAAIAFFDDPSSSAEHSSPLTRIGCMVEDLVDQACTAHSVLLCQHTSRFVDTVQLSDTLTAALFE